LRPLCLDTVTSIATIVPSRSGASRTRARHLSLTLQEPRPSRPHAHAQAQDKARDLVEGVSQPIKLARKHVANLVVSHLVTIQVVLFTFVPAGRRAQGAHELACQSLKGLAASRKKVRRAALSTLPSLAHVSAAKSASHMHTDTDTDTDTHTHTQARARTRTTATSSPPSHSLAAFPRNTPVDEDRVLAAEGACRNDALCWVPGNVRLHTSALGA
jgi:hypothetical protein